MLDPRDRRLLLEALRPPFGHRFDRAVGTTFSLDPTALLAVPLAFAAFDVGSEQHAPHEDSLALLEALRRNASRVSLFCQSGRIAVPVEYRSLLTFLEKSVVEVVPPRDGFVFHPKVWLVRYVGGEEITYRLLCLTRNLTFDRSWDTVLALEGALVDRTNAFSVNHPLGDFVAALPGLAVREVSDRIQKDVDLLQREVRKVKFAEPDGFDGHAFIPLGLRARRSKVFPEWGTRGLVVSPFLGAEMLRTLPECRDGVSLLSRVEALDELPTSTLETFSSCYVLSDMAEPEPQDESPSSASPASEAHLNGLHAKLYVIDEGWDSRVWTGSANATSAGFHGNVEFLVELRGKRSVCGVAKILGAEGKDSLIDLLDEYVPGERLEPFDQTEGALEALLEGVRRQIATLPLRLQITQAQGSKGWRMCLTSDCPDTPPPALEQNIEVKAWPISLRPDRAADCDLCAPVVADFGILSLEALTPFVAFAVEAVLDDSSQRITFVLNLPMDGEPAGRDSVVLRQMLRRPTDLIALLLLLLAEDEVGILDALSAANSDGSSTSWERFSSKGLFEALVRTLAEDTAKLRSVKRLVDDLRRADAVIARNVEIDGAPDTDREPIVPRGFNEVWEPIWQAAVELGVDIPSEREHGVSDA